MEDVGITLPKDIITYDLLQRLPSSLENIKQSINYSKNSEDIKPNALLDHLKIHLNKLKVISAGKIESISATMFTKEDLQCILGQHNHLSKTKTKDLCWMVYPKKHKAFLKKRDNCKSVHYPNSQSTILQSSF